MTSRRYARRKTYLEKILYLSAYSIKWNHAKKCPNALEHVYNNDVCSRESGPPGVLVAKDKI